MLGNWLTDLEAFEAITQDAETRGLVLRLAAMSKAGTLDSFVDDLRGDPALSPEARADVVELAGDEAFLLAVEDYVRRTRVAH
jgi:hypothetical protein